MPKRCKILFFTQNDWFFYIHFLPLAKTLAERGVDVAVACNVAEHRKRLETAGLRVLPLKSLRVRSLGPFRQLQTVIELMILLGHERPHVFQPISPKPVVIGSLAAKLMRIPVTISLLTGLGFLFTSRKLHVRFLQRFVLALLEWTHGGAGRRIVFQNRADRAYFLDAHVVPQKKAAMIPGVGTDLERFRPGHKKLAPPAIVFGGRMLRDKGVYELVEALRILHRENIPFQAIFCGDPDPGNPTSISEAELRRWESEGLIEWRGFVPDIENVLQSASIACLPSYREGMPKFLMDAAASGLPLVATDVPGCRDAVWHDENGLLVPPQDSAALADALRVLLTSPAMRERFGYASRTIAETEFSQEMSVDRAIELYWSSLKHAGKSMHCLMLNPER